MAMGGVRKEVWMLSATSTPKKSGSMPNMCNNGRKIGTKMMMISVHSSGQPRIKIISWASSRNCSGVSESPLIQCSISEWPSSSENTDEKIQEPTNSQQTMALVRAVRNSGTAISTSLDITP